MSPVMPTAVRTPVDLPFVTFNFDATAHYLWHAILDAESGETLKGFPLPSSMAPVPLGLVRHVLGSVLDLIESGQLILWQTDHDDGSTCFDLAIPTLS